METYRVKPVHGPISGRIRPPGSKSLTNRALVAAALADGRSRIFGALESEDTRVMIDSLLRLGIAIIVDPADRSIEIHGCGGRIPNHGAMLFVANSGTTVRFLTALVTLGQGTFRLDGAERMRQRPIQDLLDCLAQLGVDAKAESPGGCPPVLVNASGLRGGGAKVRGDISSQFLSGLLLAAPYADRPIELQLEGLLVSQPYVRMTLSVMRAFGVDVESSDGLSRFSIPKAAYRPIDITIEPDASAASYFFAAAAIAGGKVTVDGLTRESLQGDVAFCDCLVRMGCDVEYGQQAITVVGRPLKGIEADMNGISDTVQTLAAVALFAEGPTTIRNVSHIRHKETDRIGNLSVELRKLGAEVEELSDGMKIVPRPLRGAEIKTYRDHRMAMSLALVGLRVPGVVILDPRTTEKTYPEFFRDLERITATATNDR